LVVIVLADVRVGEFKLMHVRRHSQTARGQAQRKNREKIIIR
jgi:hypothetical protein